ncbi:uncharacterized protein BX663DRAFT_499321 [Cokeromyces recurvatus]|uniref:uncharacterized protein n=1 Tax=Cokeromyces recurvatus TaxID=90255 RepID=UPI0022211723|nr:uncharacterized protein BX663DRAFT_499321 [Cokeromyces recurvatus]KAI7906225.1 hypothetical protein BX663DRAFT_499321 [Cokeromyces recurvatus]
MAQLSTGSVKVLYDEDKANPLHNNPTVQIINIKAVNVQGGARHRVIVSDGVHFMQAMLAAQHSPLVEEGKLKRNSIITLNDFVCNPLQNRKILIILNFDIVQTDVESKIGTPTTLEGHLPSTNSSNNVASSSNHPSPTIRQESSPSLANQSFNSGTNMQLEANLTPIKNLNPYQTRWHIKARVTQKSPIKKWHNARGDGQLFSVNLLDQTGEIKATAFNDQVDRLYNMLEEGKVYYISKARVTMARKQFSTLNNEYELGFEHSTEIEACPDGANIPQMNFEFVKIGNLEKYEKGANIDVVGVVIEDQGVSEIVSKMTGKPTKKRELVIADDSLRSVRLTLWDVQAKEFVSTGNPIIACKGVRVNDFGGRSLSLGGSSSLKVNLDIPEVQNLRRWYNDRGQHAHFTNYSNSGMPITNSGGDITQSYSNTKITLQQAKNDNLGSSDKPDYFSFRGTVAFIKTENPAYPACPDCKKKLLMEENGWRCEKCQKVHPTPEYRYILTVSVEDATSQLFVNGFDEFGNTLLKKNANELMALKENNMTAAQQVFNRALFQTFNFKVRAKQETYNDITRVKYNVIESTPIDYVKDGYELAAAIDKLL